MGVVLVDAVGEHLGVLGGSAGHERAAEAGREVGLWLGDALFGAGELGGVAVDEVVHRLLGCELGDGGEDAERVGGEEDDILGVPADGGDLCPGDEVDGVGHAGILGDGDVVVVGDAGFGVDDGVLEDGPEADGVPDLGLFFAGEADDLGVAAALEVEDAVGPPAVLVIADECAVFVGGECGLSGAGESEEEGDIGGVVLGDVRRAVHGEHADLGHVVVHGVEEALLHLAGVLGAEDDDGLTLKGLCDEGFAGDAECFLLFFGELVASGIDDGPVVLPRAVTGVGGGAGLDEECLGEERVPGEGGDDLDTESALDLGAGEALEDKDIVLAVDELVGDVEGGVELGLGDGLVDLAPVDVVVAVRVIDEVLVFGRAAGAVAGVDDDASVGGELSLAAFDDELHELCGAAVGVGAFLGEVELIGNGAHAMKLLLSPHFRLQGGCFDQCSASLRPRGWGVVCRKQGENRRP